MQNLTATSLKIVDQQLWLLDQTLLPHRIEWLAMQTTDALIDAIVTLKVRGAPAIGIAASLLLACQAWAGHSQAVLLADCARLRAARPTAVNLMNNLDRMRQALQQQDYVKACVETATAIFQQDLWLCQQLARHGAALIQPGERILTHCNTGGLATAGIGTALGVIVQAQQDGKQIKVWVDETRPLLQGGRLTAWELTQQQVPYQLICDNMAGMLMAQGLVDRIFVGADRIAANGDFANKVGTYSLAVLAHYHQIPFYVVAPSTTVDLACHNGAAIPIEQRSAAEVWGVSGAIGPHGLLQQSRWAPADAPVYNPAFDVTPAALVSGWVLDQGVLTQNDIINGALQQLNG